MEKTNPGAFYRCETRGILGKTRESHPRFTIKGRTRESSFIHGECVSTTSNEAEIFIRRNLRDINDALKKIDLGTRVAFRETLRKRSGVIARCYLIKIIPSRKKVH